MSAPDASRRALILAPLGRDAQVAAQLLETNEVESCICANIGDLVHQLRRGAGFALITDEALIGTNLRELSTWIEDQPAWSDFPFVLLTERGVSPERNPHALALTRILGNVTFVERPFQAMTLASMARTALRSRMRQYQARAAQHALVESEERYRKLTEELEIIVESRTAELRAVMAERESVEAALRQSQKMEAVGQLTGGIAHDFNNLLQGIIGSLDRIQKRIGEGRITGLVPFVEGAMASAHRAASLTHRLLAFSRRQPLDPRPINANQLISSMEELLRRTMGEQIHIEAVVAAGLWLTRCDQNLLENALLNLSINARDAMPDGGRLTLETANAYLDEAYAAHHDEVVPGQYVCVSVTDSGSGMSKDIIARAFDPFFTTKPLGQGTGLGLSMVYGFARQSEGSVNIYSELNRGTTIRLYLPRYRGAFQKEAPSREQVARREAGAGEVVLIVEDDAIVRRLAMDVLHELGYQALEANDGRAGLAILQSDQRIDLLLTDVGLPGVNGRQMADAARVKRPTLKVLFMTGYAENAVIANGFLDPGMEMIIKPFPIDTLAARVSRMLETA